MKRYMGQCYGVSLTRLFAVDTSRSVNFTQSYSSSNIFLYTPNTVLPDDDFVVQHWLLFSLNLTQFTGPNNLAIVRVAQVFMPVHFSHFQITDMEKGLFTYSLVYSNPFPAWMLFTSLDSVHNSLVLCWSALYLHHKVSEFLNIICGLIWLHYIKEGSC